MILEIDLALDRYCLWSWDYLAHILRYAFVFFEKSFCYSLVLLLVNMGYLFEYWCSIGWYKFMDVSIFKIKYRRPSSRCKPNEEWPHIALPCYNESEKELFYMKWLIVDRLTRTRLIILWNVWSRFYQTEWFIMANHKLEEAFVLELMRTPKL